MEDASQDRRRQMKRQVADDDMRCTRQRISQEVGPDDAGAWRGARREPRSATGVDLDGRQRSAEFLQCTRQRAVAGADFDNGSIGAIDGLHNDVDDAAIVKEILAELMSARMRV
jgi:hypothetical protein